MTIHRPNARQKLPRIVLFGNTPSIETVVNMNNEGIATLPKTLIF